MTEIPSATPLTLPVFVTEEEVRELLAGLEPGWYRARDLLPRYEAQARQAGRRVGDAKKLGEALHRAGLPTRKVHGHASAYEITS